MPSENKTPNYGLNQWQGNEYPKRQDFVDDNADIDTALKSNSDLITEHKADTNNPHQVTPEQIGAVQGNTKAWVATVTNIGDAWGTELVVPGFEFSEGCQVTFKAPQTPTDSEPVWANRIQIKHEAGGATIGEYILSSLSKEPLGSDAWAVGAMVTVTLSSESVGTWNSDPTAFFKSGSGSLKEMFTFPLSIQTAEPTPVDTNHIWIKNDTKMPFAIDEAIRAGDWNNNDHYYGIVDSTDNNYMHFDSPKKLTDGTAIMMSNNKNNKDSVPWNLGTDIFGRKYGIQYYAGCKNKWPRIYSRINGTIDMETAYRWDGSAWYPLSQKGSYLAISDSETDQVYLYNRIGNNFIRTSQSTINIDACSAVCFSPDGRFLVVTRNAPIPPGPAYIFIRNGDVFTQPQTIDGNCFHCNFSPDSQYLIIGFAQSDGGTKIFKRSGDSFNFLTTLSSTSYDNTFSYDGKYIAQRGDNEATIYSHNGDTFAEFKKFSSNVNVRFCSKAPILVWFPSFGDSDKANIYTMTYDNQGNFSSPVLAYSSVYSENDGDNEFEQYDISPDGQYLAVKRYTRYIHPALTFYKRQANGEYMIIKEKYPNTYDSVELIKFVSNDYFLEISPIGNEGKILVDKINNGNFDTVSTIDISNVGYQYLTQEDINFLN